MERILRDVPWAKIVPMHCDLASQASVSNFATEFISLNKPLHLLVRSARAASSLAGSLLMMRPRRARRL